MTTDATAIIMMANTSAAPARFIFLLASDPICLRDTPSAALNTIWPPSNIGIGSRLTIYQTATLQQGDCGTLWLWCSKCQNLEGPVAIAGHCQQRLGVLCTWLPYNRDFAWL